MLIAQLMGRRPETPAAGGAETPSVKYAIPNRRTTTRVVGLPMIWETPLRTGNLRDPNGPQVTFAFESFIDELAAAAKADPVQFRLDMLEGSTEDSVFRRRARSPWSARRPRPMAGTRARRRSRGEARARSLSGRGIAYTYRSNTVAAVIAEVEVNRETGRVWVKRLVCAHDCGLAINPGAAVIPSSAACCTA